MGNYFTRSKNTLKKSDLIEKLTALENEFQRIDKNHDQTINKDEFYNWTKEKENENKKVIDELKIELEKEITNRTEQKYHSELIDAKIKIDYYEKQIDDLKKQIEFLHKNSNFDQNLTMLVNETEIDMSKLSTLQIEKFVDKMLQNEKLNISLLPDGVEKKIYKNIISMLMELAKTSLSTTKVCFMGHELKFIIKPSPLE